MRSGRQCPENAHEVKDDQAQHGLDQTVVSKLAEDDARPILFYARGAACWQPQLKGLTMMVSSIYNYGRFEDLWLDK